MKQFFEKSPTLTNLALVLSAQASFQFHAVSMVNPYTAFASSDSGVIIRTLNTGSTWALDYLLPVGTNGPQQILRYKG